MTVRESTASAPTQAAVAVPPGASAGELRTSATAANDGARIPLGLWAVALLPLLVLFARHWSYEPPVTMTDYAQYIMQARQVLAGHPFANTEYIFTRLSPMHGPPTYPPGFPMTLAPVIGVFGESMAVMKLLMLASLLVFLVCVGRYFAKREGPWMAAAIVLMCGVALETSMATQAAMSDLGFAALSWLIILLADSPTRWSWGRTLVITVLGFAAIGYRAAGVVLVPALALFGVLHVRRHGVRAMIPSASWLSALVVASVVLQKNAASALTGVASLSGFVEHALRYRFGLFSAHTYPVPWNAPNDVYHVLALGLTAVGLVAWLRHRTAAFSLLAIYTAGTAAMLMLVWATADRYLWPIYPVLVYGFLLGIRVVLRVVARAWTLERRTRTVFAVAGVIALMATVTAAVQPRPVGYLEVPDVQSLFARVTELGRSEQPRVLFANPRVMAWRTGVHAMGLFNATPDRMLEELRAKRITHVIVGDLGITRHDTARLRAFVAAHPERFTPIYRNSSFTLYRFDRS